MGVSIAIATHNRAGELELTLSSLSQLRTSTGDYEILVIDNASTDGSPEVVRALAPHFGGKLRYIRESQLGLSVARNRAIAEATYEIIGFLDDDVDVEPGWLEKIDAVFAQTDAAAVGGRALLAYPTARPPWLDEASEGLLTKVDLGMRRRSAQADELYGLNLCIRKDWIARVGGFRIDLGRVGGCLLSSEEAELLGRIVAAGGELLYEPTALVAHRVPPDRLRRRWFFSRIYWGKRGHAKMLPDGDVSCHELARVTWHVIRAIYITGRESIVHGLESGEAFRAGVSLAAKAGSWIGLGGRLWPKFRRGTDPVPVSPLGAA
ncbi:Chondroitin synthase [Aquisphaera giovannonii]|uniref:Chondroitin synthase n=1 Tax=Aquisphaera giovannonii TaxID=406548 RepID=A0A5B9WAZ9_9BACT|nr:glycosyltransferase [Aquisphaera giovannonii]QEH37848.1 Chondroitin synthase [Aquisphaera giovannonii]